MATTTTIYDTIPVEFDPFAGPELQAIAPSTEPQLEIWTSCLIGGDEANCAYNESFSLQLTGLLNQEAMALALQGITNMHQALRMAFSADGKTVCVYKELPPDFSFTDIALYTEAQKQAFIHEQNKQNACTLFDLVNGPLFKVQLVKLAETEHRLTFIAHHIVCDGWSIGIMMQDLSKLYSAYVKGEEARLPEAPSFIDYANQQAFWAGSTEFKATEQYWFNEFKGSNYVMDLPADLPRPTTRTYKSHRLDLQLDRQLVSQVKQLGKSNGSSFVTTLLAAFEVFLQRSTGQSEIILGLPAAGQPATGNYRLVGHCVNLLPLRSSPKAVQSFRSYLKQRTGAILDAYDHQLYTFGELLKKLAIPRDASRVPLVPVMFNIDMGMDDDVAFYGLKHHLSSNPREYESFEIFVNISGRDDALVLEWSYNTQLFSSKCIRHLMDEFEFLLAELVKNPDVLIGDIPTANRAALLKQLQDWNDTAVAYPADKALPQLINWQNDAVAVKFADQTLTYRQLHESSNRLAALLIDKGVNKGDKVAFAMDRSAGLLVVILGIMKAGGVYIPLDPQFPLGRINYMLNDSKAVVLLSSAKYKGHYDTEAVELVVEDEWPNLSRYPATEPDVQATGNDLVYILYTSGSTGMPKGVQISQHSLVNFLLSMQKRPAMTAADKLLAVTTISFDIAGLEMFLPLLSGAQVVIADTNTAKDGRALLDLIRDEKITTLQATPYTWRMMLEAGWNQTMPIKAICGGEALPKELAEGILGKASSLWNVYGPTETTIWSTIKQIKAGDAAITIGRPIANTSIYILDQNLNPVDPGTVGEIFIGGEGLATGYLNQPELTAEKFIPHPFSDDPEDKLYRTGDLGRFMEDGEIECLGRADAQVKIRGYRIETGEIEYHLTRQPDIKQAAVVAQPDKNGTNKLVAYITTNHDYPTSDEVVRNKNWRSALKNTLPDYMVPDDFIVIPAIPLTPNGKVDKKALIQTPVNVAAQVQVYAAPRTNVEKLVADIWAEFLEIEKVGIYDNFFELGGHSLIAVQVMARIEKVTGKRLPLATLFENSTVEKLSLMLEMDGRSIVWDSLVPIKPNGSKMPLYIVHGAGLNVLLFNALAINMDPDQPVYGLQAKGLNGVDEPLSEIKDIAAHYISAIQAQNPNGPYALAGYSFGGIIAWEMAIQLEAQGKQVKMLAMFDTYAYRSPFFDPWLTMQTKRAMFFLRKLKYSLFTREGLSQSLTEKRKNIKRHATRMIWKLTKEEQQEGFFGYSNKIDEMNILAERRYRLTPQNFTIELFRADTHTFYMDDFEFLGWKPYALKGINVHPIPGEHNSIFKAPNDKIFARILQQCLNEAAKK